MGRDHTTISRQLAKLERLSLIERQAEADDRRVRTATLTAGGHAIVAAIAAARQRLLSKALAAWPDTDRQALAVLSRRFVDALADAAPA